MGKKILLVCLVFCITSCSFPFFMKIDLTYRFHTFRPVSISSFIQDTNCWVDDNGIINYWYNDYGYKKNPVTISQYALVAMNEYVRTKRIKFLDIFMTQAECLMLLGSYISEDVLAFRYDFPYLPYGLSCPWTSAMAQGQVVSVLVRAYAISGNVHYKKAAEASLRYMLDREAIGGMRPLNVLTPEGYYWLEEYPSSPSSYVLNGFVFSLIGLMDYNTFCGEIMDFNTWEEGLLESLKKSIHYYEIDNWVVYDTPVQI